MRSKVLLVGSVEHAIDGVSETVDAVAAVTSPDTSVANRLRR